MVFDRHAAYYDALYRDKDYGAECAFLERIFVALARRPVRTVLDLGCGTGGHALRLAARGYLVTGVDRSTTMLGEARRKAIEATLEQQERLRFLQADIQDLDLRATFDAVVAMFGVMGYQTRTGALLGALGAARRHVEPGGLFVFDGWFGPAVLTQGPTHRHKIVQRDGEQIVRFASPTLDVLQHTVLVRYTILRLKDDRVLDEVDESHRVRFFFPREIAHFLRETGFDLLRLCPFMSIDRDLTTQEWNFTAIAKAV